MFRNYRLTFAAIVAASVSFSFAGSSLAQNHLESMVKIERQVAQAGAASQAKVSRLSDEKQKLLEQYREVRGQIDNIRIYNKQLVDLIGAQKREMASLNDQIKRATFINREITPLMFEMIEFLNEFVALDTPFLPDERRNRLDTLGDLMGRSDVTLAEKFRKMLEAYQIENDYGRTIEAYTGDVETRGGTRKVDFLRIGRIALIYQTLDGEEAGVYDADNRAWVVLDDSYRTSIRQGLRIARKQAAPDLLKLPIAAAKTAQ